MDANLEKQDELLRDVDSEDEEDLEPLIDFSVLTDAEKAEEDDFLKRVDLDFAAQEKCEQAVTASGTRQVVAQ